MEVTRHDLLIGVDVEDTNQRLESPLDGSNTGRPRMEGSRQSNIR